MRDDAEARVRERLDVERRRWQPSFAPLFSDPLVEAQWTDQLAKYYTPTDGLTCIGILLPAFAVLIRIKDGMFRTWKGTNNLLSQVIVLLVCASLFFQLALIHYKPVHYRRWRSFVVFAQKQVVVLGALSVMTLKIVPQALTGTPDSSFFHFFIYELAVHNRMILLSICSAGFILKFRQHFLAQSFIVAWALQNNASLCQEFTRDAPANVARYAQIVQWLDGTLRPDILARVVGGGAPDFMGGNATAKGQPFGHCQRTQAFLHVVLAFVLPCGYILMQELQSRARYLSLVLNPPAQTKSAAVWKLLQVLLLGVASAIQLAMLWAVIKIVTK